VVQREVSEHTEAPATKIIRQDAAGKSHFRAPVNGASPERPQGQKSSDGKKKWFKKRVKQNQ
jgi:hypothetical protein